MEIVIIGLLILLGVLLMLAEIFLLPGVTVAAIGSVATFIVALYFSYDYFGIIGFVTTLIISIILLVILFTMSMRQKNIKKFSLNEIIDSKASQNADSLVALGDHAVAKSRLNPMGSVEVGDRVLEAKSFDGFIDKGHNVVIVGFEDSIVIVKKR